ncbi:SlyX family protein [Methylocucumis oryzae]|uniref:SlyX family protein n=1 Tax=Methylocucumis oryzae TaxID=1632867 RepID=A0A0F3IE08_9GAMM|nr:SlyX family protein [Methylocucumis oryzae]KJV05040.1 SlyX family protein [Methylocucumis oryzae]
MLEQRIIELECKLAYQDDLVNALNQVVAKQQQQIDCLEKTCTLLNERLVSVMNAASLDLTIDKPVYEIPPHY